MVRYAADVTETCGGASGMTISEAPQQRAWRRLRQLRNTETHLVNGANGPATAGEVALLDLIRVAQGQDDAAVNTARTAAAAALNGLEGLTFEDKEELLLDAMNPHRDRYLYDRARLRARLAEARSRFYNAARPHLGTEVD